MSQTATEPANKPFRHCGQKTLKMDRTDDDLGASCHAHTVNTTQVDIIPGHDHCVAGKDMEEGQPVTKELAGATPEKRGYAVRGRGAIPQGASKTPDAGFFLRG